MSSPRKRPRRNPFVEAMKRGALLLQAGRARDALPHLQRAYQLAPEDVDAAINLGGAHIMLDRHKQAIPILEKAADLSPENSRLWINLGAAYLGNPVVATAAKRTRAIAAFERALELDPAAPSVNYNLGLIYRDQGDLPAAIAQFRRAAAINPLDRDALRMLKKLEQLSDRRTQKTRSAGKGEHGE